jgi:hypothetical protein
MARLSADTGTTTSPPGAPEDEKGLSEFMR